VSLRERDQNRKAGCFAKRDWRGGSPTPFDRILATRFGVAAVDLIAQGGFGKMVCLRNERIEAVDIAQAVGRLKTVDPDGQLVRTARAIGICFGD